MSKVEETIRKYNLFPEMKAIGKEAFMADLKEIKSEQEELQKKADKYDEHVDKYASLIDSYEDGIKKVTKLADELQYAENITEFINGYQEFKSVADMTYAQAKGIIEKETGVTIPHNFAEVWEARGQIAALMNTLSFELDKRDDDRSYEQFIWDSLNNSKPVELMPFIAEWADKCIQHKAVPSVYFCSFLSPITGGVINISREIMDWFEELENQKLFLQAMEYGYTVKDEQEEVKKETVGIKLEDYVNEDNIVLKEQSNPVRILPVFFKKMNEYRDKGGFLAFLSDWYYDEYSDDEIDSDTGVDYIERNIETLMRVWLKGYTVKQEQIYHVKLPKFGYMRKSDRYPFTLEKEDAGRYTESEIKGIDERYMAFAVKVEEE